jgi:hypothetical protein
MERMILGEDYGSFTANGIIPFAPTWKIMIDYGGHLTPKEYCESLGIIQYVETVNCKRPFMYPSNVLVQENKIVH